MTTDIPPVVGFRYAGFWRRFVALIIDYLLVSILVLPLVVLMATLAPGSIVVHVPFNLFTQEQVLSTDTTQEKNADGSVTVVDVRMVEVRTLGKWTYLYRERIKHLAGRTETSRQLVDPNTKLDIQTRTSDDITILVLVLYWILMETSPVQGSVGKRAMGIRVVDENGSRLTLLRALGRNVSKILSVLPCLVGFMMAGWTAKKQALHDIVARCYVVLDR
jgi:uncharacterized RDD family membrane protein YckC